MDKVNKKELIAYNNESKSPNIRMNDCMEESLNQNKLCRMPTMLNG
jgi:hypothetical protein